MKEQLISFETAKLAKEKGFDNSVHGEHLHINQNRWYFKEGDKCYFGFMEDLDDEQEYILTTDEFLPHASQSLLQKWLREKHGINIHVTQEDRNEYGYCCGTGFSDENGGFRDYQTYEDALEDALKEGLKLIK